MTAPLSVGVHTIPETDYHADPCERPSLSASIIKTLCQESPLHAWTEHPRLNPNYMSRETRAFDIGTAAHAVLLAGAQLDDIVFEIAADDYRTKTAQQERDATRAAGRIPLLTKELEQLHAMLASYTAQISRVKCEPPPFTDGAAEQTLIWQDDHGVTCRARLDWLSRDCLTIDDYKTAANANPERWVRGPLFDNGHDVQAAFYLRGVKKLFGTDAVFRFVVQEKAAPFAVTVVTPGADVLAVAEAKVEWALRTWARCLDRNDWPAYSDVVVRAELPVWADDVRWLADDQKEAA